MQKYGGDQAKPLSLIDEPEIRFCPEIKERLKIAAVTNCLGRRCAKFYLDNKNKHIQSHDGIGQPDFSREKSDFEWLVGWIDCNG